MKWNHLPVDGGIYDQHPELLKQWRVIWEEKSKYDKDQAKKSGKGNK